MAPGRWNLAGEEAIYTSTEMGVPLLERLAHTSKNVIPSNLAMMKIKISGNWHTTGSKNIWLSDSRTGCSFHIVPTLHEAREQYLPLVSGLRLLQRRFALAIPSVIVPVWNVVLYPQGIGFWEHVSLESVEPFTFDPRLFPETALVEP
jgi:RES domain-containing protein